MPALHDRGCVKLLQGVNVGVAPLGRGNTLHRGLRCRDGGNRWNPRQHRCPANSLLIKKSILSARCIDDELNAVALDQVHHVRPALFHLEHPLYGKPRLLQHVGRAFGGHDVEAQFHIVPAKLDNRPLVVVVHTEEDRAARRQHLSR